MVIGTRSLVGVTSVNFTNVSIPTALEFDISSSDRDVPCEELIGYPSPPFRIRINDEVLLCRGGAIGKVLADCDRGDGGTSAASHSTGAFVEHVVTADDITLVYTHNHEGGTEAYLPTTGGTMDGSITFSPGQGVVENNATHGLTARLGRRTTGAGAYGTPWVDFHSGVSTGPQARIILGQKTSLSEGAYAGRLWYRAGEHQFDGTVYVMDALRILGGLDASNTHVFGVADPVTSNHVGDRAYNDLRYSLDSHGHSGYATSGHGHGGDYASTSHGNASHSGVGFAGLNHTHLYGDMTNTHGSGHHSVSYASAGHTHPYSEVTGTHGNTEHSAAYMPQSGGTFTGAVIFDSTTLRWDSPRKDASGSEPTIRIYFSGTKYMYEHTSALAWKRDVETDVDRLSDAALKLRPVSFIPLGGASLEDAEPGERRTIGFIAEEVAEVLPEVTSQDDEGNVGHVSYDILSTVAIAAIQKLDERVKALEGVA